MLSTDLVILSDGAELEGLADAPDTAADTVGQDLHLSLLSSDLLSISRGQPSHPPADTRIIDPNFLKREEMMMQLFAQEREKCPRNSFIYFSSEDLTQSITLL